MYFDDDHNRLNHDSTAVGSPNEPSCPTDCDDCGDKRCSSYGRYLIVDDIELDNSIDFALDEVLDELKLDYKLKTTNKSKEYQYEIRTIKNKLIDLMNRYVNENR